MIEASKLIYDLLVGDPDVVALVGQRIYPLMASQNASRPFIMYNLVQLPKVSKDAKNDFLVSISGYGGSYKKVLEIGEAIKKALEVSENIYNFSGGATEYITDDLMSINIKYKFLN